MSPPPETPSLIHNYSSKSISNFRNVNTYLLGILTTQHPSSLLGLSIGSKSPQNIKIQWLKNPKTPKLSGLIWWSYILLNMVVIYLASKCVIWPGIFGGNMSFLYMASAGLGEPLPRWYPYMAGCQLKAVSLDFSPGRFFHSIPWAPLCYGDLASKAIAIKDRK